MLSRHRRSPRNLTLNNIYPEWMENKGVITSIPEAPWRDSVDLNALDISYHGVRSGTRFAAPVLYNFLNDDGEITVSGYSTIGRMLWSRYRLKWAHLWEMYNTEYNPLDSYSITETRTRELERVDNIEDSRSVDLTDETTYPEKETTSAGTRTPNLSETTTFPGKSTSKSETRTPDVTETTTFPTKSVISSETRTPALSETTSFPTENITKSQTRTPDLEEETVVDDAVVTAVEGTDDLTHGKETETEQTTSSTTQDNTFGFNTASTDGVPEGKTTQSGTSASTETNSGVDSRATTEETTSNRDSTTTVTSTGTETISGTESKSYTGNKSVSTTGTETVAGSESESYTGNKSVSTTGRETVSGTESESYTGNQSVSKTGSESSNSTVTESYSGTELVNRTGTDETTRDASGTESEEIQSTKTGNIFKAPAELLSIDRDFWLTEFFSIVFDDIDNMLTLSIYSESEVYHKVF